MLWSRANIKGANKDAKIYVGRSTTLHNLLFWPHTLCMNYVTNTFLLVSSSVWSKQLFYFVQVQGQDSEQTHTTKNLYEFHNHSPPLTMPSQCLSAPWSAGAGWGGGVTLWWTSTLSILVVASCYWNRDEYRASWFLCRLHLLPFRVGFENIDCSCIVYW